MCEPGWRHVLLVVVAEYERIRRIFTVDRRDFSICRPAKLGKLMILP